MHNMQDNSYLKEYYKLLEPKKLTNIQIGIYLLIHFTFLILLPIVLLEEFVKDVMIQFILFVGYISFGQQISWFIQKQITNKIFKLIYK